MAHVLFQAVPARGPSWIPEVRDTRSAPRGSLRYHECLPPPVSDLLLWTVRAARCLQTSLPKTRAFDVWTVRVKALAGSPAKIPCPTCDQLRRAPELRPSRVGPLCALLDQASVPVQQSGQQRH